MVFFFNDFQSDIERTGDTTICSYPNVVFTFVYIPNKFFNTVMESFFHVPMGFMTSQTSLLTIICTFLIVGRLFKSDRFQVIKLKM